MTQAASEAMSQGGSVRILNRPSYSRITLGNIAKKFPRMGDVSSKWTRRRWWPLDFCLRQMIPMKSLLLAPSTPSMRFAHVFLWRPPDDRGQGRRFQNLSQNTQN
jgi:hypothetical protein